MKGKGNDHMKNLKKIKENRYELKIGEMLVQMEYCEKGKKLNDCIVNILKYKMQSNQTL